MPDREKVEKGLTICTSTEPCNGCPYLTERNCSLAMVKDALELLKERLELVRCKDCKHHGEGTCSAAAGIAYPPPDEWFCADGERGEQDALDNSKC